jgi:hypothetical protein
MQWGAKAKITFYLEISKMLLSLWHFSEYRLNFVLTDSTSPAVAKMSSAWLTGTSRHKVDISSSKVFLGCSKNISCRKAHIMSSTVHIGYRKVYIYQLSHRKEYISCRKVDTALAEYTSAAVRRVDQLFEDNDQQLTWPWSGLFVADRGWTGMPRGSPCKDRYLVIQIP